MPRYLLRLAYDGTAYVGWQRQLNGVSVQQRLEEAAAPLAGGTATVVAAGRTDAGVHALGQVAHVDLSADLPPGSVQRALNTRLPSDIRVRRVSQVDESVHARFSAVGKRYRYRWLVSHAGPPLAARDAWVVAPPLAVEPMAVAARRLQGVHDFAGFQSTGSDVATTTREVYTATCQARALDDLCDAEEHLVELVIAGNGFLRHMVRAVAGTLTEIGRGRWPVTRIDDILRTRDRALAGPTAPPQGLTLVEVSYPAGVESAVPGSSG